MTEDNIAAIRVGVDNGESTDGLPLKFHSEALAAGPLHGQPAVDHPWDLPGIEQPAGTLSAILGHDLVGQADRPED
jgi:hypothetical protein